MRGGDPFARFLADPRSLGRGCSVSTRAVLDGSPGNYRIRGLELDVQVLGQATGTDAFDAWLAAAVALLRERGLTPNATEHGLEQWRPLAVPANLIAATLGHPIGRRARVVGYRLEVQVEVYDAT